MIRVRRAAPSSLVHVVPLDLQTRPSSEIRTACGEMLPVDDVEQVASFDDSPCPACSQLSVDDERPTDPGEPPEIDTDRTGSYAVALHGSHVRHRVASDAARGELDGRPVVQTLCSRLAWGPLTAGPRHWPLCEQCQRQSGESA